MLKGWALIALFFPQLEPTEPPKVHVGVLRASQNVARSAAEA